MKLLKGFLLFLPAVVLMASCCRDCDSVQLPAPARNYITFKYTSSPVFADTTYHDTTTVTQTQFFDGLNVKARKQFPIDCEECGSEFSAMRFTGLHINDTAQHDFTYYASLNSEGNVLTIRNSDSMLMFIARNIDFHKTLDSLTVAGRKYTQVLELETVPCSQDSSIGYCRSQIPYFSKLYFSAGDGLIRYEAKNQPQHDHVVYDRIR